MARAAAATAAVRGAVVRAAVARGAGGVAEGKGAVVTVEVRAVAVRAEVATAVVTVAVARVAVARAAGARRVDDSVARLGRHLDHAVDDHLLLRVAKAAMHARAGAVIPTAGCERSPLLFFYFTRGVRLGQSAGGRTGRAARSSRCRRRCASSPPPAWGSWVACSWGLPSHQQPAGAVGDRVRCAWNQNHGVDVGQNTSVAVRRRTLTTGRRLVTETRGAILLQNSAPCRREKPHACWPHLLLRCSSSG